MKIPFLSGFLAALLSSSKTLADTTKSSDLDLDEINLGQNYDLLTTGDNPYLELQEKSQKLSQPNELVCHNILREKAENHYLDSNCFFDKSYLTRDNEPVANPTF